MAKKATKKIGKATAKTAGRANSMAPKAAKRPAAKAGKASASATPRSKGENPRELGGMAASDIMHRDVVTVSRSTPLSEVERLLSEHSIGGLPVTDEVGRIVGVISVRDIIERYTQDPDSRPRRGAGFYQLASQDMLDEDLESFELPEESEETAGEVMTAQVFSVEPESLVRDVARIMIQHRIHRILVQDGDSTIGLITTFDLLRAVARYA